MYSWAIISPYLPSDILRAVNTPKTLKNLPDTPGIYLFYNSAKELIYVGKATSLHNRVRSYFSGRKTSRPIEEMIHEVKSIRHIVTDSALEALLLEGKYIKQYRPKYNVLWRDDKSWNYLAITKEEFSHVIAVREHELNNGSVDLKSFKYIFGPYPRLNTKAVLRILQKLFFISTCRSDAKRPCMYYQMGECLGVCAHTISARDYGAKVIRPLVEFLRGHKKRVFGLLNRQMLEASRSEKYEEAARLRNQIFGLEKIQDIAVVNSSFVSHGDFASADSVNEYERLECYDISNLGETGIVGSMVVFDHGIAEKKSYRKFRVRSVAGQSDVDALAEVLTRRFAHADWRLPDLIVVDGGKPQINRVQRVADEMGVKVPILGIAKGVERKKNEIIFSRPEAKLARWVGKNVITLIKLRDEAHRFAISYQRQLRKIK